VVDTSPVRSTWAAIWIWMRWERKNRKHSRIVRSTKRRRRRKGKERKVSLAVARVERSPLGRTNRLGSAFPTCARGTTPPVVLCTLHLGAHGASGPRGQAVHPGGMLDFFLQFSIWIKYYIYQSSSLFLFAFFLYTKLLCVEIAF
jgi:hypothetical protein